MSLRGRLSCLPTKAYSSKDDKCRGASGHQHRNKLVGQFVNIGSDHDPVGSMAAGLHIGVVHGCDPGRELPAHMVLWPAPLGHVPLDAAL